MRASDALPLAASVDDEQVCCYGTWCVVMASPIRTDGAEAVRAETASQAHISPHNSAIRVHAIHRERGIYTTVRCHRLGRFSYLSTTYSYLIANNVVYLTIAEKSYPRKLAFSYLDELSKEFYGSYGAKVEETRKPYAFVSFGALYFLPASQALRLCVLRYLHVEDRATV